MSKSKRVSIAVLAGIVCLFSASNSFSQSGKTPPMTIDNLYLAKGDGTGKPGESAEWFYTSDVPLYVVVMFENARAADITMKVVSLSVTGMKPESKILSVNYNLPEGSGSVWFSGRPFGSSWIPGKYRVDILIDGVASRSEEFEVRRSPGVETTTTFAPRKVSPKKRPKKNLLILD